MRRRPDGYHDVETVLVPYFGLRDVLEIVRADDFSRTSASLFSRYGGSGGIRQGITGDGKCMITIARAGGVDWDPLDDLCVRAYRLLDADFGLPPVKIYLEKTSPVGAGLGGGSADAAFTLLLLSSLFSLTFPGSHSSSPSFAASVPSSSSAAPAPASSPAPAAFASTDASRLAALADYAARLGSDCPFFIWNRPMLARGRGDVLTPVDLPQLDGLELRVTVPSGITVSTAAAYRDVVPREFVSAFSASAAAEPVISASAAVVPVISPRAPMPFSPTDHTGGEAGGSELLAALRRPVAEWRGLVVNDFEPTVFARHPRLAAIKNSLYDSGALYASMSGSGSALFSLFPK